MGWDSSYGPKIQSLTRTYLPQGGSVSRRHNSLHFATASFPKLFLPCKNFCNLHQLNRSAAEAS